MNNPYNDPRIAGDFLLSAGDFGPNSSGPKKVLDYITCTVNTEINGLEEMVNGVSVDVLAEHNIMPGDKPGEGYVIKSKYGHGFSLISINGPGFTQAFVLNSQLKSNNQDSIQSGINKIG